MLVFVNRLVVGDIVFVKCPVTSALDLDYTGGCVLHQEGQEEDCPEPNPLIGDGHTTHIDYKPVVAQNQSVSVQWGRQLAHG